MPRPKAHAALPILVLVIGVVLMVYMIAVEDEPGGIPLLLVLFGSGWLVVSKIRSRSYRDHRRQASE